MRKNALENLINFNKDITNLTNNLQSFPWDSDVTLVTLTRVHIKEVLRRYLANELNEKQLECWANAIEGREDIAFETKNKDTIQNAIHQLANPLLTVPISITSARKLLDTL